MILSMVVNHPTVEVLYDYEPSKIGFLVIMSMLLKHSGMRELSILYLIHLCHAARKLNVKHGVYYGFEVLQTCESPKHPFHIFKTRFSHAPLIIYDNACRFHVYCLNREPHFFENTQFAVDRFHWCSHIGCSKGYSLDAYSQKQIKGINSQVNEQANLGLQKIRGQLAYMSVENFKIHCSLFFLALKNIGKSLDLVYMLCICNVFFCCLVVLL